MKESLVLVLNCGSSSVKFAVIDSISGENILSGLAQCIGLENARIGWKYKGQKQENVLTNTDYQSALNVIISLIRDSDDLVVRLIAIGHRVVHGGEKFTQSVIIDDTVLSSIRHCSKLAPLHNPANISGIIATKSAFPSLPQVAVFDTAFHQTMPKLAYLYAIPYEFYEHYAIRRYGFHGTSHRFVTREAARLLNKPLEECAFISAHLGNGCSVAAVAQGKSVDTSMGLTPLEGLVMGTRSGDVDPGLHTFLADTLGYDVHKVTEILNKKSGVLGISGVSSDMRAIETAAEEGSERALLAQDIFAYRLAKYIISYMVPLGRLDALIFTGGIGENDRTIREKVIRWLAPLHFELDVERNLNNGKESTGIITKDNGAIAIVVPTNEELLIAQDAASLI